MARRSLLLAVFRWSLGLALTGAAMGADFPQLSSNALWTDYENSPSPQYAQVSGQIGYSSYLSDDLPKNQSLHPEILMNEVFPQEELLAKGEVRTAQPGTTYWQQPADASSGGWADRDEWEEQQAGWFASLDTVYAKAHVASNLNSGTLLQPTFAAPLQLPITPLSSSVMPTISIGRKTPGTGTGWRARYRFLLAEGQGFNPTPALDERSRLQFHVIDLDYMCGTWIDNPFSGLGGTVNNAFGLRTMYMNSRYYLDALAPPDAAFARLSDVGVGVHYGWIREVPTFIDGLLGIGEVDAAGVFASNAQHFNQVTGAMAASASTPTVSDGLATLTVRAGLKWDGTIQGRPLSISSGYHWERWWFLGDSNSNFELQIQGPYLRGESRF